MTTRIGNGLPARPAAADGPWLDLVSAAVQAPSSHNTQPWAFVLRPDGIELHADRTRALPVNDPEDRELVISCGCALFTLCVAAAHGGWRPAIRRFPDLRDVDHLAAVDLERAGAGDAVGGAGPASALADLGPAIAVRQTWRRPFLPQPVPPGVLAAFQAAAAEEGAWLHPILDESVRHAAAGLVAEGDALLWANPSWRRELAAWMHPRRQGDGLVVPGLAAPIAQQVVRSFDMGDGQGARDRQLADGSPLLAVLGTPGEGPAAWLDAGQALQRVLLVAARHGIQASYLNAPLEVPALRLRLQALCGPRGWPQVLLRMGVPAGSIGRAPRRPVEAVLWPAADGA